MNRLASLVLAAGFVAAALPSSAGNGNPPPSGPLTGQPSQKADDDLNLVPRILKINEMIFAQEIEGDVNEHTNRIRQLIEGIPDEDAKKDLMKALRERFPMPEVKPGGEPPKPGDPNFTDAVVTGVRRKIIPRWTGSTPDDPAGWAESGYLGCADKNYRKCLSDLGRAIDLGMKDPAVYATYGSAAHNLGDYKLAMKAASAALKMDPNQQAAFAVMKLSEGRVSTVELPSSLDAGAFEGGLPSGSPAVEAPEAGPGQAQGGPAVVPGREAGPSPVMTPEALRRVTAAEIERSAAFARQAAASLAVRDYAQAHDSASRAIQTNLQNAQAWNFRAIANNKMERFNDAVYDASFALKIVPGNTAALQSKSWALNKTGKYPEALGDANFTLEREPNNAFAYQNRAFALAGMGDRTGMLESLKRSAELDPRFKERYEAALQAPAQGDILFLFDEESASAKAPPPSPQRKRKRFVTLMAVVLSGGLLMSLGLLHIVSASWREKVRVTVRRVLGGPVPGASDSATGPSAGFWGQYELVREVGLGGMGVVYEAMDRALDRRVAIKKMRDEIRLDRRERDRFLQEARTVASLRHPNIVEIFSIVEDAGEVYLVFEFAAGRTLSAVLEETGSLPLEQAKRVVKDACEAVDCAHRHKIVHRDIKPSNIMIGEDGGAKVMDFGVARQAKEAATKVMTNTVVGTPPYMAPEAEQGTAGPQSDVFGLAVVFYEMLSGKLPFAGHGAGMLLNKLNGKFIPLSEVVPTLPAGVDIVMARALAPDPLKRYHTAAEFNSAVQAL